MSDMLIATESVCRESCALHQDKALFSSTEPTCTLQLQLIDLHCSEELKDRDLLDFRVFLKINIRICGRRQLFVQTCSEALTSVNRPLTEGDNLA